MSLPRSVMNRWSRMLAWPLLLLAVLGFAGTASVKYINVQTMQMSATKVACDGANTFG